MNKNHYVAIMAGGIGSRFWPVSRTRLPKQFLDILGIGRTLLQSTYDRFASFIPPENIFVVTFDEYSPLVAEQLPDLPQQNILAEPSRKSTAPCVAYMAFKLITKNKDACFVVSPSDHLVTDGSAFSRLINKALHFASSNDSLVTLGIKPTYANTGYGYIQHEPDEVEEDVFPVKTFTEKPNAELARAFIASGDFLWNAGIFIWKATAILQGFEEHLGEMYEVFAAEKDHFNTPQEAEALDRIYPQCVNQSIDYGVMEKARNVFIIPASMGWSDLGTWNSAYENMEKDYLGNAVSGKNVLVIDAVKNMVHVPDNKMVVLQGLDDFVVVDTNDVLLICKKEKEQDIKDYMAEVKKKKGEKYL